MRKFVLFMMVLGFVSVAFAQKSVEVKKDVKKKLDTEAPAERIIREIPDFDNMKVANADVNRITVGKAGSQRSFRREESRTIYYNAEIGVMVITCIIDPATYPEADAMGVIGQFYSTDMGQTWMGPVVVSDNTGDGLENYYPSGMLYNPDGNTVVEDAYGIGQSAAINGANWNVKVYGSSTLGGENYVSEMIENTDVGFEYDGYWNQFGIRQVQDYVRAMNIKAEGPWAGFINAEIELIKGDFDGSGFEWDFSQAIETDFVLDEEGAIWWGGMFVSYDAGAEAVWSEDGMTGYTWMTGVSNEEASGMQPLIFKTTDGGDSWDYIHLDFLSDEMQDFLDPYVIENNGGYMAPRFTETAGAVDKNGDLQLFAIAGAHSADVVEYSDSLGWSWGYPGDLFHFSVDDDGLKTWQWVDSLNTETVPQDDPGSYAGTGWQHRLQVSKNVEENEFFVVWNDTRNATDNEMDYEPDLFGWSYQVDLDASSEVVCFTEGTLYETFYYFCHTAEQAIYDAETNTYTIPTVQAVSPGEFASNGSATADPVTVSYITGIEFPSLLPVGVNNGINAQNFSVAQNQPNPFSGTTTIEINSPKVAPVMVEVTNIMGQTVYTMDAGTINGTMNIELNANDLESGVYFYTVTIGDSSVSKKMIVE
jgi:hypothetical protein